MVFKVFVALFTVSQLVSAAIPSPSDLGSDLRILVNNDLQGPGSANANSSVLLLSSRSRDSAAAGCAALGEQLWAPELKTASIQSNLDYLAYEGCAGDQQYWIASSQSKSRAIDVKGRISNVDARIRLPVICTQSAPFANSSFQDTSAKWQVSVKSNNEYLTGFRDRLSFRFLGIRYAPQPKRFTYSTAYKGSGKTVSATKYGSQCLQAGSGGSEDCLFLNIWTPFLPAPGVSSKELKPVMFWIHGGAFLSGSANDPTFDGANIASRGDVVMVAINYRVTTLGFLAMDDGITKGNFGLADQINALDWVQKNIKDFGGDPNRVMIFGQSAGAASVRALMASPKTTGKFVAAIPQSNLGGGGYGTSYSKWKSISEEMTHSTNSILAATNCTLAASRVDCLRAVDASYLASFWPQAIDLVVDGTYLTTSELIVNGTGNKQLSNIHLMQGLTRDDGAAIITLVQTTDLTTSLTNTGFNATAITTSPLFPVPHTANATLDVFNVTSRVATDTIFRCIDQATAYAAAQHNTFAGSQYFYEFNRTYQTVGWDPNSPVCDAPKTASRPHGDPEAEYFKCHSGELYFVFGTILFNSLPYRDENDVKFAQFTLDSWASFARSWDPNPEKGLLKARGYKETEGAIEKMGAWKPVVKGGYTMRELQWPSKQMGFRDVEQCASLGWPLSYYD